MRLRAGSKTALLIKEALQASPNFKGELGSNAKAGKKGVRHFPPSRMISTEFS